MMPVKIVIDADPGTDDCIGILVALGSPGLELRGVTTVGGNADVEVTTENALRLISAVNSFVPVFAGCAAPLDAISRYGAGPLARPRRSPDGRSYLELPATQLRAQDQTAVDFLIETFTSVEAADTVLVTTGPLTNVASAILRQPRLKRTIPRLILMGGSRGPGNATATADFNFWADPEAAHVVLQADIPHLVIFPLDVTRRAQLTEHDCATIEKSGAVGELAAQLIRRYRMTAMRSSRPSEGIVMSATVHDAFCPAYLVAPVVGGSERCSVHVDTSMGATRGTSKIEPIVEIGDHNDIEVVLSAHSSVLVQTIADSTRHLSARWPRPLREP
jgi:inosine-uridine nucleoside N-ribohydrolase